MSAETQQFKNQKNFVRRALFSADTFQKTSVHRIIFRSFRVSTTIPLPVDMSFWNENDTERYGLNLPCLLEIHASSHTKMIKREGKNQI
jgi:hypothetical protein